MIVEIYHSVHKWQEDSTVALGCEMHFLKGLS